MGLEEFLTESNREISEGEQKIYDWLISKKPEDNSSAGLWIYRGALLGSCVLTGSGGIHPVMQDALCEAGRLPKYAMSLTNALAGFAHSAVFGLAVASDLPLGDGMIEGGVDWFNRYMAVSNVAFAFSQSYFATVKQKSSWSFGGISGIINTGWKGYKIYQKATGSKTSESPEELTYNENPTGSDRLAA